MLHNKDIKIAVLKEKIDFGQKAIFFTLMIMAFSLVFDGYTVWGLGSLFRLFGLNLAFFLPLTLLASPNAQRSFASKLRSLPFITLLAFLFWSGVTILWAPNPNLALTRLISYLGMLVVVLSFLTLPRSLVPKVWLSALVGGIISLPLGFVLPPPNPLLREAQRFSSGGKDPNEYANLVLIVFLVNYFGALFYFKKAHKRWLSLLGWVPLLAVALSGSRTALISTIITVGAAVLMRGLKGSRFAIVIIGITAISLYLLSDHPFVNNFVQRLLSLRALTLEEIWAGRWDLWRAAWKIFSKSPLGGIGVNNFAWVSPEYSRVAAYIASLREDRGGGVAHNSFLSVLAETGLIGGILFALLQVSMLTHLWRKRHEEPLAWGLMLGFLGYWIASMALTWEQAKVAFFLYGSVLAMGKRKYTHV